MSDSEYSDVEELDQSYDPFFDYMEDGKRKARTIPQEEELDILDELFKDGQCDGVEVGKEFTKTVNLRLRKKTD